MPSPLRGPVESFLDAFERALVAMGEAWFGDMGEAPQRMLHQAWWR